MAWTIELSTSAERTLKKLDRQVRRRIADFIDTRLNGTEDPRLVGKSLHGTLSEFWGYRVGDYRLICELKDNIVTILIVDIGHRSDIYR